MTLQPTTTLALGALFAGLLVLQAWLLWRLTKIVAAAARVEDKVAHFADALSLLTETTESGFRAVAAELGRRPLADTSPLRAAVPTGRLKAAVKRGQSVPEIAAAESLSEGEVRLRLLLAEKAAKARAPKARRERRESTDAVRA